MKAVSAAAAVGGLVWFAAACAEAQPRARAVGELYQEASRLAVSAEEAERALKSAATRKDIVAGVAALLETRGGVLAGSSELAVSPASAIVPASKPAMLRR